MKKLIVLGMCLGLSGIAQGSHNELYSGKYHFNVGATYSDLTAVSPDGSESDDSELGGWLAIGFSPNNYFGFEADYYKLGELYKAIPAQSQSNKIESDAFGLSTIARGFLSDRFVIYGSVGAAQVNLEYYDASSNQSYIKEDDIALRFGLGLEYFAYKELTFGLDFKQFKGDIFDSNSASLFFKYVL